MGDERETLTRRPSHIISKARKEYDKVLQERIFLGQGYPKAVKAAIRAYDKVLRDYDRKTQRENSSN